MVAVECLNGFVVTHTDNSQFGDDAIQLFAVQLALGASVMTLKGEFKSRPLT